MKKVKLTEEDYIQALDYAHVLGSTYLEMLSKCKVIKNNKEVAKAFDIASQTLLEVYQTIGNEGSK